MPSVSAKDRTARRRATQLAGLTWVLMMWGAATRAARAGLACPDRPLCHGQWIPPLSTEALTTGTHTVGQVWMEFVHRVLAAGVVLVTLLLWRPLGERGLWAARGVLVMVLALQVGMGAVTVWWGNAPWTVVTHLALALAFLGTATSLMDHRAPPQARSVAGRQMGWMGLLVGVQMLVGAKVSASLFGLACADFPLCQGQIWPAQLHTAIAWQLAHRALGFTVVGLAVGLALLHRWRGLTGALGGLALLQLVLGALNVWLGTPVWVSTLHLGVAALMFGTCVRAWGS